MKKIKASVLKRLLLEATQSIGGNVKKAMNGKHKFQIESMPGDALSALGKDLQKNIILKLFIPALL